MTVWGTLALAYHLTSRLAYVLWVGWALQREKRTKYYARTYGWRAGQFPVAEDAYRRAISLPLYPRMSDGDVADVAAALRKVVAHFRP